MGILSIAVVKSAGVTTNYFAKDDYYAKEGAREEATQWYGKGAEAVGLSGPVQADQFGQLLEGRLPDGTRLGRTSTVRFPESLDVEALLKGRDLDEMRFNDVLNLKLDDGRKVSELFDKEDLKALRSVRPSELLAVSGNEVKVRHHRPGWDFTFSAPKSVSILYEVGGDERLLHAHETAVSRALDYLEKHGAQTRVVDQDGRHYVQTGNLIVARFNHDTSREMDPQLHTHSFVMNATQLENGEWRSVESRTLYRMKMLGGAVYKAELAKAVKGLGYEIEQTHADGRFEASVVPKDVIQEFSKRRQQIEERLKDSYVKDAKSAEDAALKTRTYKREESLETLRGIWGSIAKDLGFDVEKAATEHRVFDRSPPASEQGLDSGAPGNTLVSMQSDTDTRFSTNGAEAVAYAAAKLGERESVFSREDLLQQALTHAIGEANLEEIETAVEEMATEKKLINATLDGQAAWTTPNAIYLERSNIAIMRDGQNQVSGMYQPAELQTELDRRGFTPGQRSAAEMILTTHDRIVGVQGFAGTGKTYMLDAVRELAEARGYVVKGFAQGAAAANVLATEAGIPSTTIAQQLVDMKKLLSQTQPQERERLIQEAQFDKQLWVVDEASMVSSRDAFEFQRLSERVGARIVWTGDKKQLPAVEAGKPFAQLQRGGMMVAEMRNILRQEDEQLRSAVYDSIDGHARRALEKIENHVHEIDDKDARLQAIVSQYLGLSKEEREKTLVLSPANEDRVELNNRIREGLQIDGSLTGPQAESVVLLKEGLTEVERERASSYEAGQVVRFNRGYRSLGVEKGEYAHIMNIDKKNGVVALQTFDGKAVDWSPHKVGGKSRRGGVVVFRQEKRALMQGEKVRWTDNDKQRGIINAEQAMVEKVDGTRVTFRLTNGQQLTLDVSQPENKHWDHVYTSTVFSAQGQTANRVIVHGEDWRRNLVNQKSFYVGISRPKLAIDVYVNDKEKFIQAVEERAGDKTAALESVDRNAQQTRSPGFRRSGSHETNVLIDHDGLLPDHLDYEDMQAQKEVAQAHQQEQQRQDMERETSR